LLTFRSRRSRPFASLAPIYRGLRALPTIGIKAEDPVGIRIAKSAHECEFNPGSWAG